MDSSSGNWRSCSAAGIDQSFLQWAMRTLPRSARSNDHIALLWALERCDARQSRALRFAPRQPFRESVERVERRPRSASDTVLLLAIQRSMIVNNLADLS